MTEWPDHYPPMCPPADARPARGIFIRFVDAWPPEGEDTMSHVELRISGRRTFKSDSFGDMECEASGYSVFEDIQSAKKAQKAMAPLRRKLAASIDVTGPGVIKRTGRREGHHTWWRPVGDDSWVNCEIVA